MPETFTIKPLVSWGYVIDVIGDQADLQAALAARSVVGHTHVASEISNMNAVILARVSMRM